MKKRQHMLLPLTAVALLLSGCGTAERISNTEKDATATLEKARRHAGELRKSRPVVTETTRQWINPSPVSVSPAHQSLPGCPIIINTRRDISLRQIAQRITGSCGIPVTITADVWQALATTGPTQQLTGAIPAPDPNGMVPLAAFGSGAQVIPPGGGAVLPELSATGLRQLLDTVASRLGISYRYDSDRRAITFYWLETRTFPVTYMDSQVTYNARVVSDTASSSSGSSTGSNAGTLSGEASNTQTTTVDMKSTLYEDLKNAVGAMLTPGTGRMVLATGFLTVTDTPRVLDTVSRFVEARNREMRRQVVLNVEVLSVRKTRRDQAGIDWNAVFSDGRLGLTLGGAFSSAADDIITSGVSIVDGKLTGSKAFLKALSSQGTVSVVTQNSAVTKNMTPVPMQVASQQGYIEGVTTDTTANVGTSTSLNAATITTGFNMTLLPFIQPDARSLQLLFSMNLSDKPTFEVFESGGSRAQVPTVDLKTINQTIDLKSGQTVILSGFRQSGSKSVRQGVGSPAFFGLGGGTDSGDDDTILVVLITPHVI